MKKKQKTNIEDMTMEELDKKINVCKKQAKAYKIATTFLSGGIAAALLSFAGLLITSIVKSDQEYKAVAKLVEKPKQVWILEESNKIIEEIKNDTNITPESLADYNNRLNDILSTSNYKFVENHASNEIKNQYAIINEEYNEQLYFNAGMSCMGFAFAMILPVSYFLVPYQDKKQRIKECQNQKEEISKCNEILNKTFNKVVTSEDIEQEYK